MVNAAKEFIQWYVRKGMDDDDADHACDLALEEWNAWVGNAFNQALDELGLLEEEL